MTATRYDLTRDDLTEALAGEPRYRLDQVWRGLYEQLAEPAGLTTLPKGKTGHRTGHETSHETGQI